MIDSQTKISVILPFYNSENELNKAIQSIVDQTYPHWTLILVSNNGSETGRNIALRHQSADKRIRLIDKDVKFHKLPEELLTWTDHPQRLSRNHENYSKEAFFNIKCQYLARWIKRTVPSNKKIIVCGSSRIGRKRADLLKELGVNIFGFTDVKKRPNHQVNFVPYQQITEPEPWFLINFIGRRGVGGAIRKHFITLGFTEGKDLILAA
jgi:glycosyltransferase involved in cell wall biosynthesis